VVKPVQVRRKGKEKGLPIKKRRLEEIKMKRENVKVEGGLVEKR